MHIELQLHESTRVCPFVALCSRPLASNHYWDVFLRSRCSSSVHGEVYRSSLQDILIIVHALMAAQCCVKYEAPLCSARVNKLINSPLSPVQRGLTAGLTSHSSFSQYILHVNISTNCCSTCVSVLPCSVRRNPIKQKESKQKKNKHFEKEQGASAEINTRQIILV